MILIACLLLLLPLHQPLFSSLSRLTLLVESILFPFPPPTELFLMQTLLLVPLHFAVVASESPDMVDSVIIEFLLL